MKAREVRELLRKDHDPKLVKALEMICDEASTQKHTIVELAKMLDRCLDHLAMVQQALGNMQAAGAIKQTSADVDHMRQTHIQSPENLDDKLRKQSE